mmetsp:Transcript_17598/g.36974  ORF Transcript_17598/g.36974 Transcript_17598/m.36974 type:complete len:214 (+) Transcript_17598:52-693(+)
MDSSKWRRFFLDDIALDDVNFRLRSNVLDDNSISSSSSSSRRRVLEIHGNHLLHARLQNHPPRLRLRRHIPHRHPLLLIFITLRKSQQRRHRLRQCQPLRNRIPHDRRQHIQRHRERKLRNERQSEHEPGRPRLVTFVVRQPRPSGEKSSPQREGQFEKSVEESAQTPNALLHQKLPAKHGEISLGDVVRRPNRIVGPGGGPIRIVFRFRFRR